MSSHSASPQNSAVAANAAHGAGLALNFEAGAAAPDWVQLLPAGPRVVGVDGREWTLDNPARLVAALAARPADLVIDYDHATDIAAPMGLPAPAAGWIKELDARADGTLWGRVEWTAKAAAAVAAREWRYLSPVFTYDAGSGAILELLGAALVNRPNLKLAALNTQGTDMLKDILAALGLPETGALADAVTAINALKAERQTALNAAATPDLTKFVPRADFDAALNRATTAETKIAEAAKAAHEADVTREIEAAVKAGKITPATKDFYLATCATAEGLAAFRKFVEAAPSAFAPSGLDKKDPAAGAAPALNAEQREVARAMGLDEKAFAEHLAKEAAKAAA